MIKYYFEIPSIEDEKSHKKMKSLLKYIYNDNKILIEYKEIIIENAKKFSKRKL